MRYAPVDTIEVTNDDGPILRPEEFVPPEMLRDAFQRQEVVNVHHPRLARPDHREFFIPAGITSHHGPVIADRVRL